jgi:hypothetical protein
MGFESVQFLPEGLNRMLTVKFYVVETFSHVYI